MARPSLFEERYVEEAYTHCLVGATDADLAEHFGVAVSTLYEWKKEFPEFSEAIKKGKRPADVSVASALFQRATGAEWVEQQAIKCKTVKYENGKRVLEEERVEVVDVLRRAPPDTVAAIFWLKNRQPGHWRDKRELEVEDKTPADATPGALAAAYWPRIARLKTARQFEQMMIDAAAKQANADAN